MKTPLNLRWGTSPPCRIRKSDNYSLQLGVDVMKVFLYFLLAAVAPTILAPPANAAPTYTDSALFDNGWSAYNANPPQCVRAAEFLFAYTLRNPPAMQQNPQHRIAVQSALTYCETNTKISNSETVAGVDAKADLPNPVAAPPKPDVGRRPPTAIGNPQKRCNVYAAIAVAQNQSNLTNHCSFSGSRWDSRFQYHLDWCMTVPGDEVRGETLVRQSMLDQCAP